MSTASSEAPFDASASKANLPQDISRRKFEHVWRSDSGVETTDEVRVQLLQRCAARDPVALGILYASVAPHLLAILLRILRRSDLAEDALQEVFISLWRNAASYRPERGSTMAWMAMIARYRALDMRRSQRPDQFSGALAEAVEETTATDGPDVLEMTSRTAAALQLAKCMQLLSSDQNQAIRLAFIHGMTHQEVASELGLPVGTVKSWIRRGLMILKSSLRTSSESWA